MRGGLILLLLIWTAMASATEIVQLGENTRSFGMGGVRVPMEGHDAGAFLWNPAVLTYAKGMSWEIFNLGIGTNTAYQDLQGINLNGLSSLDSLYGEHFWAAGQGDSAFTLPFFGMAVYDQASIDMTLHNPAFPVLDVNYLNDYAFVMGGSVPLGPQGSFGISAKRIDRLGGPQEIGAATLNSSSLDAQAILDQFQNEGVGYGLDAGLMYRVPTPFNPTVSLAWQDVGDTAFIQTKGSAAPPRIENNLTLSTTFEEETMFGGVAGGFEYRHITQADETLGKKLFLGMELSIANIDLRGGLYQGYGVYGIGVNLWLIQLDAALYEVERGDYPGQTPEQRAQIGLSMNFSFDPDFHLTDTSGKRRHLKQRR